jgi:hypothetical protein
MVTDRVKIAIPKMRMLSGNRNISNPVVFILLIRTIEIISKKNAIIPVIMIKVGILTIFSILFFFINKIVIFKSIVKKLSPVKMVFSLRSNDAQ